MSSIISNSHWGYDVEDNAYALMRTETGVVGCLILLLPSGGTNFIWTLI